MTKPARVEQALGGGLRHPLIRDQSQPVMTRWTGGLSPGM